MQSCFCCKPKVTASPKTISQLPLSQSIVLHAYDQQLTLGHVCGNHVAAQLEILVQQDVLDGFNQYIQ
jgi:hypothetical protein